MTAPKEPTNPSVLFTPFIESTFNIPEEEDRLKAFLNDVLSNITDVVNDKKIGAYTDSVENFNGNTLIYITTTKVRNGYQSMVYIPSFISETITQPIPNINNQFVITKTWGSASLPPTTPGTGDYFSFMPMGDTRISYTMSDTQIVITTDGARASYSGFIFIEYLRDGF
jgi:hypothetical protein